MSNISHLLARLAHFADIIFLIIDCNFEHTRTKNDVIQELGVTSFITSDSVRTGNVFRIFELEDPRLLRCSHHLPGTGNAVHVTAATAV